jgi:hypothetical protein
VSGFHIIGVNFPGDGSMIIEYSEPLVDLKANGAGRQHAIMLPDVKEFEQLIESMRELAERTLSEVMSEWKQFEMPEELQELDLEPGFDNPNERSVIRDG